MDVLPTRVLPPQGRGTSPRRVAAFFDEGDSATGMRLWVNHDRLPISDLTAAGGLQFVDDVRLRASSLFHSHVWMVDRMSPKLWISCGAFLAAVAVAAGAFGAHGLKGKLEPPQLEMFEVAVRYQMYHAMALVLVGFGARRAHGPKDGRSRAGPSSWEWWASPAAFMPGSSHIRNGS